MNVRHLNKDDLLSKMSCWFGKRGFGEGKQQQLEGKKTNSYKFWQIPEIALGSPVDLNEDPWKNWALLCKWTSLNFMDLLSSQKMIHGIFQDFLPFGPQWNFSKYIFNGWWLRIIWKKWNRKVMIRTLYIEAWFMAKMKLQEVGKEWLS